MAPTTFSVVMKKAEALDAMLAACDKRPGI